MEVNNLCKALLERLFGALINNDAMPGWLQFISFQWKQAWKVLIDSTPPPTNPSPCNPTTLAELSFLLENNKSQKG